MSQMDKVVYLPLLIWFVIFFMMWYMMIFTSFMTYLYSVFRIRIFYLEDVAIVFFYFIKYMPRLMHFFLELIIKYLFKTMYVCLYNAWPFSLKIVKNKYNDFITLCFPH